MLLVPAVHGAQNSAILEIKNQLKLAKMASYTLKFILAGLLQY